MAVFPKRIVQKNSTDTVASIKAQVVGGIGNPDEIVPGELVLQRDDNSASLIALDANNRPVVIGSRSSSVAPGLLLNFEDGTTTDTPHSVSGAQSVNISEDSRSYDSPGKFGGRAFRSADSAAAPNISVCTTDSFYDESLGIDPWTLQFWIKGDVATWQVGKSSGLILCKTDYLFGPGAFTVYLDGGTPDYQNSEGTSTSETSDVAKGAVVFGLRMPKYTDQFTHAPYQTNHANSDPLIPITGEIVHTGVNSALDGNWHHICLMHEGDGSYVIFFDGVEHMRKTLTQSINHDDPGLSGIQQPSGWSIGGALVTNDLIPADPNAGDRGDDYGGAAEYNLDAISLHAGIAIYRGLHSFTVPTNPPTQVALREEAFTLRSLPDTDIPEVVNDLDILQYNASRQLWETSPAPAYDLSANNLGDIGDVELDAEVNILDKEVLSWDSATSTWKNLRFVPENLGGVTQPGPIATTETGALLYDGASGVWEFKVINPEDLNFETLEVTVTNPLDGDIIYYSATEGKFLNAQLEQSGIEFSLESLRNVDDTLSLTEDFQGTGPINVILAYDHVETEWKALEPGSDFLTILVKKNQDDIAGTLIDGGVLTYNATDDRVELTQGLEADISNNSISDLVDVNEELRQDNGTTTGKRLQFPDHTSIVLGSLDPNPQYGSAGPGFIDWSHEDGFHYRTCLTIANSDYYDGAVDFSRVTSLKLGGDIPVSFSGNHTGAVLDLEWHGGSDGSAFHVKGYKGSGSLIRAQMYVMDESSDNSPGYGWRTNDDSLSGDQVTLRANLSASRSPRVSQHYTWPLEMPDTDGSVLASTTDGQWSWIPLNASNTLEGLSDVDLSVTPNYGLDNYALVWDNDAGKWDIGRAVPQLGGSSVGDLFDVDLTTFDRNEPATMIWDPVTLDFVPGVATAFDLSIKSITDLSDVNDATPADGDTLVYDVALNQYVPSAGGGAVGSIDDLTDVDVTTGPPAVGQALIWNGTEWVPGNVASGGSGSTGQQFAVSVDQTLTTPVDNTLPHTLIFNDIGGHGHLTELTADADCWVVLYATPAALTSDSTRLYGAPIPVNAGVLGEFTLQANDNLELTPALHYFNQESITQNRIFVKVRSTQGVDLYSVQLRLQGIGVGVFDAVSGGTFGSG